MTNDIQALAQKLVDLKIEMKRLDEQGTLAKLELFEGARGGVKCNGGMVYFVESGESKQFNKDKLREALEKQGLNANQIETIFSNSIKVTPRDANIHVRLD